jgi:hypothetical protein
MNKRASSRGRFELKCRICGGVWFGYTQYPDSCGICGTHLWNREAKTTQGKADLPLPQRPDYSEKKCLSSLFGKCPYCRGTTGLDNFRCVAFCFSCDSTFSLTTGQFLGVLEGIGIRR